MITKYRKEISMNNELINIKFNENQEPSVSARELHKYLEVGSDFRHWFPRMCKYGFEEREDYSTVIFEHPQNHQPTADYEMTIDMAKEISMIQRNENGKKARQYFLKVEKDWNSPEKVMARALLLAEKQINTLQLETRIKDQVINELKPKADYTDKILRNKGLVTITQIAKDYGMSGQEMNKLLHELGVQYKQSDQWLLYKKYQNKGFTHSETINFVRSSGIPDVNMVTKWTQKGRLFLYELLKQVDVYPNIEKEFELVN